MKGTTTAEMVMRMAIKVPVITTTAEVVMAEMFNI